MHRRTLFALLTALTIPAVARSQTNVTPLIGGYIPAGDLLQVKADAQSMARTRDGTRSLGLNVEFGSFRGSLAYVSRPTLENASPQDLGKNKVLGIAADAVVRPVMRMLVQPYLVIGVGQKFSTLADGDRRSRFAFHGGVGADLMVGPVGVAAELTDFACKRGPGDWNDHDAFLMVGMRLRLP